MTVPSFIPQQSSNTYRLKFRTESYVSKKSNDESEFWKGGKLAYDDKNMKDNVVYQTMNRLEHKEYLSLFT